MSKSSVSDRQLAAALAGTESADTDVVDELVRGLRAEVEMIGLLQDSESHILAAMAAVTEPVPQVVAPHVPVSPRRLRARLASVMASIMALLLATAGVGLAADGAAPGDPLYGLDLAMERVGIGNGKANERLSEAIALAEAGQLIRGLDHAAATLATLPDQAQAAAASEALADAAARLLENGNTPTGVGDLLSDLASFLGTGDGQSVAETARKIRDTVERGRPEIPGGSATDRPGRPDGLPGRGLGRLKVWGRTLGVGIALLRRSNVAAD